MLDSTSEHPESIAERRIPKADGMPILGSLKGVLRSDMGQFLTEQYLRHGPVYQIQVLNQKFTVLAGLEANQFVARKGNDFLSTRDTWKGFANSFGAQNFLLTMDGADHTRMRKIQRKGYSRNAIERNLSRVIELARDEIRSWPAGEPLSGRTTMQKIIADQIGTVASGTRPLEYLDDLIYFVRTIMATTVTKRRSTLLLKTPRFKRARKSIEQLGQYVIDKHSPENSQDKPADLIDDILKLADEEPDFLPQSDLLLSVLGPFVAGLDTAASATTFALYVVLKDPKLRELATQEADRILSKPDITPDDIKQFDVIQRIIMESQRLYPTSPALKRTVKKGFTFSGYHIPEGETVVLATTVPHYLPEFYPEPEKFDIDRYLPERKENGKPGSYVPFGLGAHTCLGAGSAEVQMIVAIASLLYEAELEMHPFDYNLKIDPIPTPSPDDNFRFKILRHRRM